MRAVCYQDRNQVKVEWMAKPKMLHPTDAIARVMLAGICGADVEFVGVVEAVGKEVRMLKVGDRVAASPMFVDGTCYPCRRGQQPSCEHAGLFRSHIWPQ